MVPTRTTRTAGNSSRTPNVAGEQRASIATCFPIGGMVPPKPTLGAALNIPEGSGRGRANPRPRDPPSSSHRCRRNKNRQPQRSSPPSTVPDYLQGKLLFQSKRTLARQKDLALCISLPPFRKPLSSCLVISIPPFL